MQGTFKLANVPFHTLQLQQNMRQQIWLLNYNALYCCQNKKTHATHKAHVQHMTHSSGSTTMVFIASKLGAIESAHYLSVWPPFNAMLAADPLQ